MVRGALEIRRVSELRVRRKATCLPETDAVNCTGDQERGDVLRDGAGDDEDEPDEQGRNIHDPASVELTERGEEHRSCSLISMRITEEGVGRTYAEADNEEGDAQSGDFYGHMEFLGDADEVGGDDGGVEGDGEADGGDHERAPPLLELRPVLRVLRVIDGEGDELVLLLVAVCRVEVLVGDGTRGGFATVLIEVGFIGELAGRESEVFLGRINEAGEALGLITI